MNKAGPDLGSQAGLSGSRKEKGESSTSAANDIALLNDMEKYKLVDAMLKGDEGPQDAMPEYVVESDSLSKGRLSFGTADTPPKDHDVTEYIVNVQELSSYQDSQQPPYHDPAKFSCEAPVSSCSQGTFQGEVSLSVGEGTISSDIQRRVVPHEEIALMGGSLGRQEDEFSDYSFYGRSLHAQDFHDIASAGHADISQEFAFEVGFLDDGGALGPKSVHATSGEDCVNNVPLPDAQVCDDGVHSRHASDPGFYEREAQEMSPRTCLEGSASPQIDAVDACMPFRFTVAEEILPEEASDERVVSTSQVANSSQGVRVDEHSPCFGRVKDWINSIQLPEVDVDIEDPYDFGRANTSSDVARGESSEIVTESQAHHPEGSTSVRLANAAVRSLHPFSTVAHLSGISLREVPSLGVFSSLRSLNLSANDIAHVPVGSLPRSLHSLDLSRNRIAQIEGFRELTRLRILNLSYNRIARIGHGLANCTLIKELCLAGNKLGEVEGLHRLLKLAVLDLSFNKITTSKAVGQLAANYGSLLALNLIGNPILTNFSEDQLRKLVTTLVPHVAYLNRQPIKAISVREAALDNIARAALGTSHRHGKGRDIKAGKKASGVVANTAKKKLPPHQQSRASEKKLTSTLSIGHHLHHGTGGGKVGGVVPMHLSRGAPELAVDTGKLSMPRSRSAGVLQE